MRETNILEVKALQSNGVSFVCDSVYVSEGFRVSRFACGCLELLTAGSVRL